MCLEENKTIDLDKTLSNYIELADTSDKKDLKIREILAHQSGLAAWIPFYIETLEEEGSLRDTLYSTTYSDTFSVRVADNIYLSIKIISWSNNQAGGFSYQRTSTS